MKIIQVLLLLLEKFNFTVHFEFEEVNLKDIEKEIFNLNTKKAVASNSIPAKVLKNTSDICSPVLQQIRNDEILKKCQFPENLKLADITPVFKKEDNNLAKNYRPVSVLPTLSKVFEKIMQKQVINHVNTFLFRICVVTERGSVPNTFFCHNRKMEKEH